MIPKVLRGLHATCAPPDARLGEQPDGDKKVNWDTLNLPAGNPAAAGIARALIEGFDKHYRLFREMGRSAKQRFEAADWPGQQRAVKERIQFYDDRVQECVSRLREDFHADSIDDATWQQAKLLYIGLLLNHRQPECAETFFNSVTTKILHRDYFHNDYVFVRPAISTTSAGHCPTHSCTR